MSHTLPDLFRKQVWSMGVGATIEEYLRRGCDRKATEKPTQQ